MTAAQNRLATAFAHQGGLGVIAYVTAGFPRRQDTAALLLACEAAGCLAVEVGIPFSDPLADGPVVQRAGQRALENGMTLALALGQVDEARQLGLGIPVAVMTYVNPILSYGIDEFVSAAAAVGVDGVIIPDLPGDEAKGLQGSLATIGLAHIPLVAPTTPTERLRALAALASGFIYCVGVNGVTGARESVTSSALDLLERVRSATALPRGLGFGIARPEHLAAVRGHCEAVVVGSALLTAIEAGAEAPTDAARRFLESLQA